MVDGVLELPCNVMVQVKFSRFHCRWSFKKSASAILLTHHIFAEVIDVVWSLELISCIILLLILVLSGDLLHLLSLHKMLLVQRMDLDRFILLIGNDPNVGIEDSLALSVLKHILICATGMVSGTWVVPVQQILRFFIDCNQLRLLIFVLFLLNVVVLRIAV